MLPVEAADGHQHLPTQQTNYLILRTLEHNLPKHLFTQLLIQIHAEIELPEHTAWDGRRLPCSYQQLRESQTASDSNLLARLVQNQTQKNLQNFDDSATSITQHLKNQLAAYSDKQSIYSQLHRQLARPADTLHKVSASCAFSKFDRIKTVFCHTNFSTDEVSPIYNVYFDQKGTFIISAGDEGIIKVWDRDTLTLQASLHGHQDYITEVDISKCNRFIVSAGKDKQIILWELATGKLLYKLSHHTKLINCVKFFTPKPSSSPNAPQQQFLFSASDDGTVRLYDLTNISAWALDKQQKQENQTSRSTEEDQYRIRRSQRQQRATSSSAPDEQEALYQIELTPDDFRPGTRNKKLDTLVMNHQGLVVAGSSSCEILIWRLNYDLIGKKVPKQDCQKFLGQFKMSRQSCVKFCEFSPKYGVAGVGDILLTGSNDGVINLWNMNVGQWRSTKESTFDLEDKARLLLTIDDAHGCRKTTEVKVSDLSENEQTDIILEDIEQIGLDFKENAKFSKSVCDCVRWSCNGRFAIASVQCRIESENSDFCRIKIWDNIENSFIEDLSRLSGIRLPKNTFVLATHPVHEEILVSGSDTGILALWNLYTKQLIRQFKQHGVYSVDANIMDSPLHGSWSLDGNAFISGNTLGTISLYSIEDVHHQYEATRVQQFFQFDVERQADNPFEKITDQPTICGYNMMPYEVQPSRLKIRFTQLDPSFTAARFQRNLALAKELGAMEERYYQDKLQSSLFEDDANFVLPMESIQVSQIQPAIYDAMDVDSDVQIVEQLQDRQQNRRPRLQRNNQRAAVASEPSFGEASSNSDVSMDDSESSLSASENDESEIIDTRRRNHQVSRNQLTESSSRPQRAARPTNLRDTETVGDDLSVARPTHSRSTRTRARRISSSSGEEEAELSDDSEVHRNQYTKIIQQTASSSSNRNRLRRNIDQSSPEQVKSSARSGKTRRQQQIDEYDPRSELQRGTFYLSDHELVEENDDKQDYSSHMLIKANELQQRKMESTYELQKPLSTNTLPQPCCLCRRTDGEIVGPFGHPKKPQIYLHKDCIEVNTYSYFSVQQKKWVNIETMLQQLQVNAQYQCYRCEGFGASVACLTCGLHFHGYYCAGMYLISSTSTQQKNEGLNSQFWQCLFCKNQENYETALALQEATPNKDQKQYLQSLKKIDKSHLLSEQSHQARETSLSKAITYMPQVDDVLLYFFQGHEDFVYQYNCHFYAGQQNPYPKRQTMPWFSKQTRKLLSSEPICLCKVNQVVTLFPSQRSLGLIQQFGETASEVTQVGQMIQRVELEIISTNDKFTVDLFPSELPDFLVLYQVFIAQQAHFLKQQQSLQGREVTVRLTTGTQRVKIIEESPLEALFAPQSLWQTLVCQPSASIDLNQRRQQSSQVDQTFRVSFWQIVFDSHTVDLHGLREHEHCKLKSYLQGYMQKNREYLVYFKERVQEKIAYEYRQIIPQEMWFDLLYARLANKYYRSARQFFEELQMIATNAAAYNGEGHEIAEDAKELVRKCKCEALKFIDQNGDRQLRERVQEAASKLDFKYHHVRPQSQNLLRDIQPRRNVIQINTASDPFEESKEEIILKKRQRRVQDSPELEIVECSDRTRRKRQRQM